MLSSLQSPFVSFSLTFKKINFFYWSLITLQYRSFYHALTLISLTFLRLSMAKSKISPGKCHTALEHMWAIFKYLLILISNIIPSWEQTLYDFNVFRPWNFCTLFYVLGYVLVSGSLQPVGTWTEFVSHSVWKLWANCMQN